jgi:hypothetical protein
MATVAAFVDIVWATLQAAHVQAASRSSKRSDKDAAERGVYQWAVW